MHSSRLVALGAAALAGGSVHGAMLADLADAPGRAGPPVLHDNGLPDGINGYSNSTSGVFGFRRTLLDDFVVPFGETWTLERFEWRTTILHDPPAGTGAEFELRANDSGSPGPVIATLAISSYSEIPTGNVFWSGEERMSWVDFDPVELPAGHYWFEGTIVSTENNFWLTASPIQHNECWVNYEDLGGLQPGTEQFEVPADLSWRLMGERDAPGVWACCFPTGDCLEVVVFDCEAQNGLFQGGVRCDLGVCGAAGACCFPDNSCIAQSELFCALDGGTYSGVGVACTGTVCNVCGEFADSVVHDVGGSPDGIRLADLDGDGDADMAVSARGAGGILMFINAGDGTFASPVLYPAEFAEHLSAGDIDGDGDIDIVTTGQTPNRLVIVLLNNGDGTFVPGPTYDTGISPWYVGLGDLNGDLAPDIVVVNASDDDISVRLNDGAGAFGARTDYPAGDSPRVGAFGDLDGDLHLDFAVANPDDRTVSIFFGNGDGTLAPRAIQAVTGRPFAVAIADLDGDLDMDLVVPNAVSFAQGVVVLLNNGDGTFVEVGTFGEGRFAHHIEVGDLDGDSDFDVVVSNNASGDISVLLNNGDATFATSTEYEVGIAPRYLAIGDVDGDHAPDIAVPTREIIILFNDCPPCAPDLDGSGAVDFGDILRVLSAWGNGGGPEDLDGSGTVDFQDLLVVLGAWGPC